MNKVIISDPTLRDGNHAINHNITLEQISLYTKAADEAGIDIIEVGHGNGLGASSLQLGLSKYSDHEIVNCARENIKRSKLSVHVIPGFAKLDDIKSGIENGVDIFRIASHCTEANITAKYIEFVRNKNKFAHGVLMMSHMADLKTLVTQAKLMVNYGAQAIVIMDSAGAYFLDEVSDRITALVNALEVPIGFHAHNNLGLAVANTIIAVKCGASIIDATSRGFGAGAGNTPLEVLVAVLKKIGIYINADLYKVLDLSDFAEDILVKYTPTIKTTTIVSGLYGVFSGFEKHVIRLAKEFGIDPKELYKELGKRNLIAGQEDLIIEISMNLKYQNQKTEPIKND